MTDNLPSEKAASQPPSDKLPPSSAEVEAVAEEMISLKGKIASIEAKANEEARPHMVRLAALKMLAEAWLRKHGSAHSEKSKLLHGLTYEIMGTFGMSMSIDAAAVELFRQALVKAKLGKLLRKLFKKTVRFEFNAEAAALFKGDKLKPKLAALWAKCLVPTPKTAVITPREKKKEAGVAA